MFRTVSAGMLAQIQEEKKRTLLLKKVAQDGHVAERRDYVTESVYFCKFSGDVFGREWSMGYTASRENLGE